MKKTDSIGFKLPAIIIITVNVFVIALIIVATLISVNTIKNILKDEAYVTLDGYSKIVNLWFNASEEKIDQIVADPHEMEQYILQRTEANRAELVGRFERIQKVDPAIHDVILLDKDFTFILDTTKDSDYKAPSFDWSKAEFMQKLKQNNYELAISTTTYKTPARGFSNDVLYIASGVRAKESRELLGVLILAFDFSDFNKNAFATAFTGSNGGHIFITDNSGNVLADPYTEHIKNDKLKNSSYIQYSISHDKDSISFKNEIVDNKKFFMAFNTMTYKGFINWRLILTSAEEDMFKDIYRVINFYIIGIIIVCLLIITVIIKILKPVTFLLKSLATDITKISSGDLSFTVPDIALNMKDEFGIIAKAIHSILTKFGSVIQTVVVSSKEIDNMAEEVSNDNSELSERTESQAASLEETASSMEEMASTIKSSAENSVSGKKSMMTSKTNVEEASSMVNQTTQNINEVLEASKKISDITKMIESIALQTNILALNAAVEAARAGEQGRGFAVVASEVRNLAQTTQTSVKDITSLIVDVDEKIKKATDSANKSREIFIEVEKTITDSVRIMEDISSTSIEQQTGVDQINKAISEIDNAVQQNASIVQNSSKTSEILHEKSTELVKLMEYFKLKE